MTAICSGAVTGFACAAVLVSTVAMAAVGDWLWNRRRS